MIFLVWNCQGSASALFKCCAKDLIRDHEPNICIFLEPCISGVKAFDVFSKLGFKDLYCEDARGFSGGIWLLWNGQDIGIQILSSDKQHIHFCWSLNKDSGLCTAVYGSPNPIARCDL